MRRGRQIIGIMVSIGTNLTMPLRVQNLKIHIVDTKPNSSGMVSSPAMARRIVEGGDIGRRALRDIRGHQARRERNIHRWPNLSRCRQRRTALSGLRH